MGPADDANSVEVSGAVWVRPATSVVVCGEYGPRDRLYSTAMQGCLWLCAGHSHEGCLDVTYISGTISCLLSAEYLLTDVGGGAVRSGRR